MYNLEEFIDHFTEFYFDDGISPKEARKYTEMYIKLFPNFWNGGDSVDREKVYGLYLIDWADSLVKQHKEKGVE